MMGKTNNEICSGSTLKLLVRGGFNGFLERRGGVGWKSIPHESLGLNQRTYEPFLPSWRSTTKRGRRGGWQRVLIMNIPTSPAWQDNTSSSPDSFFLHCTGWGFNFFLWSYCVERMTTTMEHGFWWPCQGRSILVASWLPQRQLEDLRRFLKRQILALSCLSRRTRLKGLTVMKA